MVWRDTVAKALNTEEFKKRAQNKFGDKFDYHLVDYSNCIERVTIICPEHGHKQVSPLAFLNSKYGCPECRVKHPKYLQMGAIYGRLTVIGVDGNSMWKTEDTMYNPSEWKYLCRCSCEEKTITAVTKSTLCVEKTGTKSCGCLQKESLKGRIHLSRRKTNPIEVNGDVTKIFFFNAPGEYTTIDTKDYDKVKDFCWCKLPTASGKVYAKAYSRGKTKAYHAKLHQIICPCEEGYEPDHHDGNSLNNCSSNLIPVTHSKNVMNEVIPSNNTTGYKGVHREQRGKKWIANIGVDNKRYHLGTFETKEEAIKARKEAEAKYHGNYAHVNNGGGSIGTTKKED